MKKTWNETNEIKKAFYILDREGCVIFILFTPSKQIVMTFLNKLAEEKFVKSRKAWDFGV